MEKVDLIALAKELTEAGFPSAVIVAPSGDPYVRCSRYDDGSGTGISVSDDGTVDLQIEIWHNELHHWQALAIIARHVAPAPTGALRAAAQALSDAYEAHVSAVDRHDKNDEFHAAMAMSDANDALRAALDGGAAPVALTEAELESLAAAALDRAGREST